MKPKYEYNSKLLNASAKIQIRMFFLHNCQNTEKIKTRAAGFDKTQSLKKGP